MSPNSSRTPSQPSTVSPETRTGSDTRPQGGAGSRSRARPPLGSSTVTVLTSNTSQYALVSRDETRPGVHQPTRPWSSPPGWTFAISGHPASLPTTDKGPSPLGGVHPPPFSLLVLWVALKAGNSLPTRGRDHLKGRHKTQTSQGQSGGSAPGRL